MKIPENLYPDIISAAIGVLTIISSLIFLIINIKVNRVNIARDVQRIAFANYYLPIKFKLGYINNLIKHYPDIDIFLRKSGDLLYENRRKDILIAYQEFLEWLKKSQFGFLKKIDKQIFLIIDHMQCIVIYYEDNASLSVNKDKYPLPDLENVIKLIDEEFEKGNFL